MATTVERPGRIAGETTTSAGRGGAPRRARTAYLDVAYMAAVAIFGFAVFLPGLKAGLVSDDYYFYHLVKGLSFGQALAVFEPTAHTWYRPINDFGFWVEVHVFGFNPTALHLVNLIGHLVSSVLLYRLARTLGLGSVGALATGVLFVASIHAQEVVWWWADAHYAFCGPFLIGSLAAWFGRRRPLAVILAGCALLTDEAAVLIFPVTLAGELIQAGSRVWVARAVTALRSSSPLLVLLVAYLSFRVIVGGGVWSESTPCRSIGCVSSGLVHYSARLVLRPDLAYTIYEQHHKYALAALAAGALAFVAYLLLRQGRTRDAAAFGLAWTVMAIAFFVLTLWPYAADRFLYYPDMGLALVAGAFVHDAVQLMRSAERRYEAIAIAGLVLLTAWGAAGVQMLEIRAGGWLRAGDEARKIVDNIDGQVPNPPDNVLFVIDGVPDSGTPPFPPGNTGPYVFRNALQEALKLRYDREDISVSEAGHPAGGVHGTVIHLQINADDSVQIVGQS